jgi:succinate dehydrogenase/fumarate reductase iron-sulfur protein
MAITFKILRFDPEADAAPYFQEFIHEPRTSDSILDALKEIRDEQDPTIAFRYSCREAVCGSCGMVINGEIALACRRSRDRPTRSSSSPSPTSTSSRTSSST